MQGTSGNHFAANVAPQNEPSPVESSLQPHPPGTNSILLQGTFERRMWVPFILCMWLPLCHVGSTSDRTRSTESLVCIRYLSLLHLFGRRELCVLSDQTYGGKSCFQKMAVSLVNPNCAKTVLTGTRFLPHFSFSSLSLLFSPHLPVSQNNNRNNNILGVPRVFSPRKECGIICI